MKEPIYVVLLDYCDEKAGDGSVETLGAYRSKEKAQERLQSWKEELLNGMSWESDAYAEWKEKGEEDSGYVVTEDANHFEIYEDYRYDTLHTYCRIINEILED